jgi:hypothetical protein
MVMVRQWHYVFFVLTEQAIRTVASITAVSRTPNWTVGRRSRQWPPRQVALGQVCQDVDLCCPPVRRHSTNAHSPITNQRSFANHQPTTLIRQSPTNNAHSPITNQPTNQPTNAHSPITNQRSFANHQPTNAHSPITNQRSFANHHSSSAIADYQPYCQVLQVLGELKLMCSFNSSKTDTGR